MKQDNPTTPTQEQSFYSTGNTDQKKSHRGLYTALIVLVILLVGALSVMGLLNIQLFRRVLELDSKSDRFAFRVTRQAEAEQSPQPARESDRKIPEGAPQLQLQQSPPAIANIPCENGISLQEVYTRNIPGVVSVIGADSTGTGVIITDCGYLVTDRHLLGDEKTAEILFHDGSLKSARLIGADLLTDLAVLDVDAENLTPVTFCDDAAVQVGDPVIAIGTPFGADLPGTMTSGMVAAINRNLEIDGRFLSLLQTDAVAAIGNSGGPLLNCYGQVIGIHGSDLGAHLGKANAKKLGFAIPSSMVKEVVDQLLLQGHVSRRAALGFTVEQVSAFDQLYYKVPAGLFITAVDTDAPLQLGDILLSFAGHRIGDTESLQQLLNQYRPGDAVTLTVYREGQRRDITITLKENQ